MSQGIFLAKDFNFDDYDVNELDLLCKYRLPILTEYPKLVVFLYNNQQFVSWLNKNNIYNENTIINKLINIIKIITKDNNNKLITNEIDINDNTIWNCIIDSFIDIPENSKKNLSKKKHRNKII